MATNAMFQRRPWDVWIWYLYRHFICRRAAPNPAHHSLAKLQNLFPGSVTLITQNVDGLHLRAESPQTSTYEIHGNIDFMRCSARCTDQLIAMPIPPQTREPNQELSDHEKSALKCSSCDGIMRPHVLWFDECYEEELFRSQSSLRAAEEAELLLIIGTSGTTSLPVQIARIAALTKIPLVNINPQPNPFGDLADRLENGIFLQERAGDILPTLADALLRNQD
jgi:NAD-dependent deacetylase